MTAASRSGSIIFALVCLTLCLAFSILIYVELGQQAEWLPETVAADETILAKPTGMPEEPPQEALVFAMPARVAYNEVLQRPPFSEARRPAPAGVAEAESDEPIAATVMGTILSASGVRALIAYGEPPQMMRVIEGQEIDGWKVKSILKERVVVTRGNSTIELRVKGNATPAISPDVTSRQPAKRTAAKAPSLASPIPAANTAKAPPVNTSASSRPPDADEAAVASDPTLSQLSGRLTLSGAARGTGLRGGGGRGR